MAHANRYRVVGQSLESMKLQAFELKIDGQNYFVKSESLNAANEWILRHTISPADALEQSARQSTNPASVRLTAADISRLDEQAKKTER